MKGTLIERINKAKKKVRNAMRYRMRQAVNFALADEPVETEVVTVSSDTSSSNTKETEIIDIPHGNKKKSWKRSLLKWGTIWLIARFIFKLGVKRGFNKCNALYDALVQVGLLKPIEGIIWNN